MFLKKLEEYDHSTPGKIKRIKLSKIIFFTALVIMGIVFSSLTETESATIFNTYSINGTFSEQLTINSK